MPPICACRKWGQGQSGLRGIGKAHFKEGRGVPAPRGAEFAEVPKTFLGLNSVAPENHWPREKLSCIRQEVLAQKVKHKHTWLDLSPLAIWSANDLPGPISGYSPHRLLFGRDPVGFGEHPPLVADHGSEDALQFFRRVQSERNYVRTKLTQIHAKLTAAFNKAHPTRVFQPGERVWIRVSRQPVSGSKLERLWVGPAEIMQQISDGAYKGHEQRILT